MNIDKEEYYTAIGKDTGRNGKIIENTVFLPVSINTCKKL